MLLAWQGRRWKPENVVLRALECHLLEKGELWVGSDNGTNKDFERRLKGDKHIVLYFDFRTGDFNYCSVNGVRVPNWWGKRLLKASRTNNHHFRSIVHALKPQNTPLQISQRAHELVPR